jgi:hypothetical protein
LSKQFAGANNPTKIIAMANQKGGLGKMIFVINIGISLPRLLVEKGIFSKEEYLETVKVVEWEMRIEKTEVLWERCIL